MTEGGGGKTGYEREREKKKKKEKLDADNQMNET